MDFDLEQALDFTEKRNTKRSIQYNEKKKKKRKLHSEQAPDNELPDVISAFPLYIAVQPQITINAENNCLLKEQMDENLMEYEENFDDTNQMENLNIDDNEIIDSSSDSSECCNDREIIPGSLLHHYTSISTKEFCSNLLTLLRNSNTCKLQANRLLSFINSILPTPNNVPKKMEHLLKQLEIENNTFKKYLLCASCNDFLSFEKRFCFKCSL